MWDNVCWSRNHSSLFTNLRQEYFHSCLWCWYFFHVGMGENTKALMRPKALAQIMPYSYCHALRNLLGENTVRVYFLWMQANKTCLMLRAYTWTGNNYVKTHFPGTLLLLMTSLALWKRCPTITLASPPSWEGSIDMATHTTAVKVHWWIFHTVGEPCMHRPSLVWCSTTLLHTGKSCSIAIDPGL